MEKPLLGQKACSQQTTAQFLLFTFSEAINPIPGTNHKHDPLAFHNEHSEKQLHPHMPFTGPFKDLTTYSDYMISYVIHIPYILFI